MQNDNQNQTPETPNGVRPDYGFLQEYASAPPPKKKIDKKVVLMIILLILTGLVFLVSLFIGPQNEDGSSDASVSRESIFIQNILESNTGAAYAMLAPELSDRFTNEAQFNQEVAEPLRLLLTENNCQNQEVDRESDQSSVLFSCTLGDQPAWFGVGLTDIGQTDEAAYKLCSISAEEITQCR